MRKYDNYDYSLYESGENMFAIDMVAQWGWWGGGGWGVAVSQL